MKNKSFNLNIRISTDEWQTLKGACSAAEVGASTVIRDLCQAVVPYIAANCKKDGWRKPKLTDPTEHTWDVEELQIVLDHAKSIEEVKDLVYTVLARNLITWDSSIPTDKKGYLAMVKDAVKARLKDLREGKK